MDRYRKGLVALAMALITIYQTASGVDLGLDEATVTQVLVAITAVLVYLVPNAEA